jgi:hypothetical protein
MSYEPASSIIGKLGGLTAVSKIAGVSITTVQRWRMPKSKGGTGGIVPHWHHERLLEEARSRGIALEPVEFIRSARPEASAA